MSQENVEVVRRGFDEMNRVGISNVNLLLYFHPDVEYLPLRSATEGAYRGIAGIERFTTDTEEVFEKFEPHYEFLDLGERVLAWGVVHIRARGSGIETDIAGGSVFDFRDGKIVRWEGFGSKEKAVEALGLRE
jgi:ketosteroid isomerase-like protein